ncbi:valine--tRNA ligase [bacterium]|nr:valine--tRNA ligase [bacterium]
MNSENLSENARNLPEKLLRPYDPQATEERIYEVWEKSGYFNPDNLPKRHQEPFSVVLPPPNVTGILHMGHAYEDSLQDAIVRYQRMRGKKVLWLPGTDSAAIATQARVEKDIQKEEGKNRHDIGREELVRRVSKFAKKSENTILSQIRKMGASLDWSRYAYTMDEKRNTAVTVAFERMYDAGLIYRGNRIVNWDPKGQTTVSDDEVEHKEVKGKLYTFKYSKDFPISIATTRPETKIGDTGVAVHPEGKWKEHIGKEFVIKDFAGYELNIKIVADESVDEGFGTGAVGLTPAHSGTDWDIAEKNDLPVKQVINEYAKIQTGFLAGALEGKKTLEARELIVDWLKKENLLEREEEITQNISVAERSSGTIEPLPKLQWFIAVNKEFIDKDGNKTTLKKIMRAGVESGSIAMPQERFKKIYFHWIDNLHDWCISRQIWFGHRIPVWYHESKCVPKPGRESDIGKCEEIIAGQEKPVCRFCDAEYIQDSDVLDTWFSSALWTFSTLGWPAFAETATAGKPGPENDLANYHPTSFMSPAYEILPLWVSRMILMSGFHLGQVPFKTVLIHGLVRDKQGHKFSKSLGNGIDPLYLISKYGADAVRMGLLIGTAIGNDISFDESKVKGYKNFANKIWNASRFVLQNLEDLDYLEKPELVESDRKILEELNVVLLDVTKDLEEYRFYLAGEKLYHYFWHEFADKIIESSKPRLLGPDVKDKVSIQYTLFTILSTCLKVLHPFMPFITEEIWNMMPIKNKNLLMIEPWPST